MGVTAGIAAVCLAIGGAAGYAVASSSKPSPADSSSSKATAGVRKAESDRLAAERASAAAVAEAQASALAEAKAAAAEPPAPSAFRLAVKILQKKCFGSAGCNVTYRVDPKFLGPGDPNDTEVTYEVLGGEDGPQVNTFTIDSAGTASYPSEETVSTPSSRTVLTARVTDVRRT
jgi:hypothetical protein